MAMMGMMQTLLINDPNSELSGPFFEDFEDLPVAIREATNHMKHDPVLIPS